LAASQDQRFEGVGLTEDQRRRIDELGPARRAWNTKNQEQLKALREQKRAAAKAGDTAGAERALEQLQTLRATAPDINDVFSELSDEQRAKLRQNRPDRRGAKPSKLGSAESQAGEAP
jgi:hypothetical protein